MTDGKTFPRKPVVSVPSNPDEDAFWVDIGKSIVQTSLDKLGDRSKFVVTTVAALITANVGIFTFTFEVWDWIRSPSTGVGS